MGGSSGGGGNGGGEKNGAITKLESSVCDDSNGGAITELELLDCMTLRDDGN